MWQRALSVGGGGSSAFTPTVIPSSSMSTSSFYSLDLGFAPKHVIFYGRTGNSTNGLVTIWYDVENNTAVATYDSSWEDTAYNTWIGEYFKVEGTNFMFKAPNNAWITDLRVFAY
jgi:hypothetical protein